MNNRIADEKTSVAALYEDSSVASSYLEKRMQFSWQRLLHTRQVEIVNEVVHRHAPDSVLELAPGPARISAELDGIKNGVMIENSEEMLKIARERLRLKGKDKSWEVIGGSAFDLDELLGERQFGMAYTFRFLRHFRDVERQQLYQAISRHVKKDGLLVFDVVNKTIRDALDAGLKETPKGELAVYDVTYTIETFNEEMAKNGYAVEAMYPVMRQFGVQSWLSYKADDIVRPVVRALVNALEKVPSTEPLEWVAVCRKQ